MTAAELRNSLLRTLWAESPAAVPTYVHKDVATAVNQAFQTIWSAPGYEYLRRRKDSVTTSIGEASYTLDQTLLQMIGPVTTPSWPLIPLNSKGDWQQFTARFLQADTDAQSAGQPLAYYLERLYSGDTDADPVTVKLLLAPTPTSAILVEFEASYEPPSFTDCELDDDATILPIPHGFIETLLLPIARWQLTSSHWFKKSQAVNSLPAIEAQYGAAMRQLGLADPQIKSAKPESPAPKAA